MLTDGRGRLEPLPAQWDAYPSAVSSDGRTLYYSACQSLQEEEDIVSVALGGEAPKPAVLLATLSSSCPATCAALSVSCQTGSTRS